MEARPLSQFKEGEEVVIRGAALDEELRFRLYYMGLYPGSRVKVVRNDGKYPVLVEVHGSLVAISADLVHRVFAERLGGERQ